MANTDGASSTDATAPSFRFFASAERRFGPPAPAP
jgi:hypothetical protein